MTLQMKSGRSAAAANTQMEKSEVCSEKSRCSDTENYHSVWHQTHCDLTDKNNNVSFQQTLSLVSQLLPIRLIINNGCLYSLCTVKPVYKSHSKEPENMTYMSSYSLYAG